MRQGAWVANFELLGAIIHDGRSGMNADSGKESRAKISRFSSLNVPILCRDGRVNTLKPHKWINSPKKPCR
jgi:hypothetical protein